MNGILQKKTIHSALFI